MRKKIFGFILFFYSLFFSVHGQSPLIVRAAFTPEHLVKRILLNEESTITVSNIQYVGSPVAVAAFSNRSKYYLIKKGIILSTGLAEEAIGPNQRPDNGVFFRLNGDEQLEEISTGKTYDACVLSFDFIPDYDSIKFNYVFASEEYPEFVDKGVNDIFGFFIQDLETGEIRNLASIGTNKLAVNVDNINAYRNENLYIENGIWKPTNVAKFRENPGLGELALTYEFDGFTTLLVAGCGVIPGRKYRITFAIADVGDGLYDSAVFLEEASFKSFGKKSNTQDNLFKEVRKEFQDPSVEVRKGQSTVILSLMVNFDFDQAAVTADSSLLILNKITRFLKLHSELTVGVEGHTDNFGSEEYNWELSKKRAKFAADYFIQAGIENTRITTKGFGDKNPIAENITSKGRLKNRRIEFVFNTK